jgi:hypothetical protein
MSQLYTNVWHVEAILKRVDQLAAVIRPAFAEASPSHARYHDSEVEHLKERITERDDSLRRQLAGIANQPKVERNSSLQLSGWARRTQTGSPEFRQEKTADGQEALFLGAKGNSIGSWRTSISLEEGAYRFEGKVRTRDVKPSSAEPTGGAGLRVAGNPVASSLSGTQDWQNFAYSFRVPENGGMVQVICELRASQGEAWFDTSSLRVVRLR